MSRKNTQLSSLETRKQLLLAESEINRVHLLKDLELLKEEVARLKKEVYTVGSIASTAALVATAVSLFRRHLKKTDGEKGPSKMSWITTALEGVNIGASLFQKVRSFFRERE